LFCVVCLGKKCPKTLILFMSSSVDISQLVVHSKNHTKYHQLK
jgi:hypothetical protein